MHIHICGECGQKFETRMELVIHNQKHLVKTIRPNHTYLIQLHDGCCEGRWEAAVAFDEAFQELELRLPGQKYQILPYGIDGRAYLVRII